MFGEEYSVPNIDWTNEFFGSTNIAGTRIVFANGSVDPWHNLGLWEMSPANPFEFPYEITGTGMITLATFFSMYDVLMSL